MITIFVSHAETDVETASNLVDVLESALKLPDGAIACSSLPGYGLAEHDGTAEGYRAVCEQTLAEVKVVLALRSSSSIIDPQTSFELGICWALTRWIVPLVDSRETSGRIPWPVSEVEGVRLKDRKALTALLEDLSYNLGVELRVGQGAKDAMEQLVSNAPGLSEAFKPTPSEAPPALLVAPSRPKATETDNELDRVLSSAPPPQSVPPPLPSSAPPRPTSTPPPIPSDSLRPRVPSVSPAPQPVVTPAAPTAARPSTRPARSRTVPPPRLSCGMALEAGRVLSDCAFNRDEVKDVGQELQDFGQFVDAMGGSWIDLQKLDDFDVWIGMTDNLLEGLPPERRHLSEWYELGCEMATLLNIAGQDVPEDPEDRQVFIEAWQESIGRFRQCALEVHVRRPDVERIQAQLENLIGPYGERDYANVSASLQALREQAHQADQGLL